MCCEFITKEIIKWRFNLKKSENNYVHNELICWYLKVKFQKQSVCTGNEMKRCITLIICVITHFSLQECLGVFLCIFIYCVSLMSKSSVNDVDTYIDEY